MKINATLQYIQFGQIDPNILISRMTLEWVEQGVVELCWDLLVNPPTLAGIEVLLSSKPAAMPAANIAMINWESQHTSA